MKRYLGLLEQGRKRTNWTKKVEAFQEAIKLQPKRPEAFYLMMVHYYYNVLPEATTDSLADLARYQAFAYGMAGARDFAAGKSPPEPLVASSGFEKEIIDWRYQMELSVIAHATKQYEVAYRFGKQLLDGNRFPPAQKDRIEANLQYFGTALCVACTIKLKQQSSAPQAQTVCSRSAAADEQGTKGPAPVLLSGSSTSSVCSDNC